jgi:fatty-acyl-CoA synthase
MESELTVPAILRRAETFFGDAEIVSRRADKSLHRYRYRDLLVRAKQLAMALRELGVKPGERVATLAWNHHRHLESYVAITAIGAVLHTLNLRLHPNDLSYIINHADDRVLIIDDGLLPLFEQCRSRVKLQHIIVMANTGAPAPGMIDFDELGATTNPEHFTYLDMDEHDPAAMCYTSGTTGVPKGTLYSHRAIALQSLNWLIADLVGIRNRDVILPVVPMFHIQAWCLPFAALMAGATLVLPDRFQDPDSLLELMTDQHVTVSAGAPAVWLAVLQALESAGRTGRIGQLEKLVIGGSAAPRAAVQRFQERHDVTVVQAWGMTETTSLGLVNSLPADLEGQPTAMQYDWRARQGMPPPFVEIRARSDEGLVPWDDATLGELEIRGPTVAREYYEASDADDRFTDDGWFRTGDVVTINARGCVQVHDRIKDLIRSGSEWISSVSLENALLGHPAVAEAAVIAIPHPKWQERPLACVVLKPGSRASTEELRNHLAADFPKWWLPDVMEFVDQIPRTSTGKPLKSVLRDRFKDYLAP